MIPHDGGSRWWFTMVVHDAGNEGASQWYVARCTMSEAYRCWLTHLKMAILHTLAVTRAPLKTVHHVDSLPGETLN
jgi:hypothetical protein